MKGKIDDDCHQDSTPEDAGEGGGINVYCDLRKGASRGDDNADDDCGRLRDGLWFYFQDQFHLPRKSGEEKN